MYPAELGIKDMTKSSTSASYYLDLLLSIGRDGQLRTSLYDQRDDFAFNVTNFPFLGDIPSSPAYGIFISQLLRYAMACSYYENLILKAMRLLNKPCRNPKCSNVAKCSNYYILPCNCIDIYWQNVVMYYKTGYHC